MHYPIMNELLLILVSFSVSQQVISWNLNETTRVAKPLIREFSKPWTRNLIQNQFYHYKTHFGIIIKGGTNFSLSTETRRKIENLFFYCLTDTANDTFNMLDLSGESNFTKTFVANYDCVPMMSVSNNVLVTVTLQTREWLPLPIFYSNDVTLHSSEKDESDFYQKVQVYGFVENYYTQMLLSVQDIDQLKSSSYNLYVGLLNQIEVIEYYDYLTTIHTYEKKAILSSLKFIDRTSLFIRSERCDENNFLNSVTCSKTNFNLHWIVTDNIKRFLQPERGSSWILLQQFAHYYNKKETDVSFGETYNLWNDMFAILYQQRFRKQNNRVNTDSPFESNYIEDTENISDFYGMYHYQEGKHITQWTYQEKLCLFVSLFGYDGTDSNLREFRVRHTPTNEILNSDSPTNIVPTILEIFFDLYDISLLPFFKKVFNFNVDSRPLVTYDLELLLLSGKNVMPAVDFNIKPIDLKVRSNERDLRLTSPLMLMTEKVEANYVSANFTIESTMHLRNCCLYLNNICQTIVEKSVIIKLLSDVYSVYVAEKKGENLYISEITYHTITEDTFINIKVRNIQEKDIVSLFVHYSFDALDVKNNVFLNMFINYKNMTLRITEFYNNVSTNSRPGNVYFFVNLKRNGSILLNYTFTDYIYDKNCPILQDIKINDEITIYHQDADRLKLNLKDLKAENSYTFLVTNTGLRTINPESKVLKYEFDVQKSFGPNSRQLLKIFVNYKNMTIEVKQFLTSTDSNYGNTTYFTMRLLRNDSVVFEHLFLGNPDHYVDWLNFAHKFEINDVLYIDHIEPKNLNFNLQEYNAEVSNAFVFKNDGLHSIKLNEVNETVLISTAVFHCTFDVLGSYDELFLQIFINYNDSTIILKQMNDTIDDYFNDILFFSVRLERNGISVFNHNFIGGESTLNLTNVVHKFNTNDKIHFYIAEPELFKINLKDRKYWAWNYTFVFGQSGLINSDNVETFVSAETADIKRITKFHDNYKIDLSYNKLYQIYFAHYLRSNNLLN
ncbi:uncharacterized protein LOC122509684 [Leptopilina heterotoma]|uniref:uncharacterized protein LOC122509684 n=1 Tax=Leptopilina heterotoma TaxID=63436 RepID=UPI001CAA2A7E|nr:uncharacterized protein LOC122509684 [Leptopilina heterotoma]